MICPYCGKEISDSSKFCRYCGQKQERIQPPPVPPQPVVPVSPAQPSIPEQPKAPVTPAQPPIPEQSEASVTPAQPPVPEQPKAPVTPTQPPVPEQPKTPVPPVQPPISEQPKAPVTPTQPPIPEQPKAPVFPVQPPVPVQPEKPVYSAAPVRPAEPSYPKAAPVTPPAPPQKPQKAHGQSSGGKALAIVLAVLLFLSVAANAYQYLTGRNSDKMLAAYAEESDSLHQELGQMDLERQSALSRAQDAEQSAAESEALLEQRNSEIEALNVRLMQWQQEMEALSSSQTTDAQNTILTALARFADEANPGGSSDIFKVSQPLMVLHKSGGQRRFVLTTDFDAGSIISMETTGDAADVAFTESSWGSETDMTVTPNHAGVVWASFTNDNNAYTITMLIIVLDD